MSISLWVFLIHPRCSMFHRYLKGIVKLGFVLTADYPSHSQSWISWCHLPPPLRAQLIKYVSFRLCVHWHFIPFLRMGELTSSSGGSSNLLQLSQITKLLNPARELIAFKLTFGDFKHSYKERPFSLVVS